MSIVTATRGYCAIARATSIVTTIIGITLLPITLLCIAVIVIRDRPKPYRDAAARSAAPVIVVGLILAALGMLDVGSDGPCGYFVHDAACVAGPLQ